MAARLILGFAVAVSVLPLTSAHAEPRKPTAQEIAAIRNCAAKYQDDLEKVEQRCLFELVATPCTNTHEGSSNVGTADCYRTESAIWDSLLNENFKNLLAVLDDQQTTKLREMQRAWIAYRDTTCNFYWDKIQGTMAIPMSVQCARNCAAGCAASVLRPDVTCSSQTPARRAVLLRFFDRM
jgi:uncharacterized protein YecT (DUF1311 family)